MDEWLNKADLRQIYLVFGSVLLLSVTALVMLIGKPVFEAHRTATTEAAKLKAELAPSQAAVLAQLNSDVEAMEQELLGSLRNIPVRQLESHIIASLQKSAWATQTRLLRVEPQRVSEELPYEELAFRVEVLGRYSDLNDWLRALSLEMGDVIVKEYDLSVDRVSDDPQLRGRLMLTAYRVEGA